MSQKKKKELMNIIDWVIKFLGAYRRRKISFLIMGLGGVVARFDWNFLIIHFMDLYFENPNPVSPSGGSSLWMIIGILIFFLGLTYPFLEGILYCFSKGYFHDYRLLKGLFKDFPCDSMNEIWNHLNNNTSLWDNQLNQLENLDIKINATDYNLQDTLKNKELKRFGSLLDRHLYYLGFHVFPNNVGNTVLYKMNPQNLSYPKYNLRNHRCCVVLIAYYKKLYEMLMNYKSNILSEIFI